MKMFANLRFFAYVIVATVPAVFMGIGEKPYRKHYIFADDPDLCLSIHEE